LCAVAETGRDSPQYNALKTFVQSKKKKRDRTPKKKTPRISPRRDLGDDPRCHRIHLRTWGEVNAGFEAELFVEGGLQLGKPFPPSKSFRAGNNNKLTLFLGTRDELVEALCGV